MSNPSNKFRNIKRALERGDEDEARRIYLEERDKWATRVENLKNHVDTITGTQMPADERFLKVVRVPSSNSKLTYAPKTGRVEVKISEGASDIVAMQLKRMAELAMPLFISTVTVRGRIKYDTANGVYFAQLWSEGNRTSVMVIYDQDTDEIKVDNQKNGLAKAATDRKVKDNIRELFEKYHNERYNPNSEHYRFEHFYNEMIKVLIS